ncbi:Annexin (Annexin) Family [Phytophthora nicotianae]|uniref:Annexin (Annexin) Family n=1 Tax=Phytophthora nicotianae TaxID=4792 RepID=A0A0W8DSE1_PHYNI|nr:Annexin (Annexin) Family [Phytophthora nicotianae]
MWMQNSVAGGNFHDRNRFGSQYGQSSYSGGASHDSGAGDWKSKILESGQWLGGKVIEYGGKLARGPNTDSIPDHYAHQMPRNDGRANWMADIRSSSSSYSGGGTGGYGGGYQNDFATERPKAYSDYNRGHSSNPPNAYEPKSLSSTDHHKHRHAKKKSDSKKSKKHSKKSKKKQQSESESPSESESEELSISESSETESADERRHKSKSKKKSKTKKHGGFYSSDSDEDVGKRKASADYSFSFDPAKLPPPPVEESKESKKPKKSKSKKEKTGKKSRTRRQSVASTDEESVSEKENTRAKAKKRGSKKAAATATATVDLLGVDLDAEPVAQPATATQEVQPSIFDTPQNPLQDLAGLSFAAPVQASAPQPSVFDTNTAASTPTEAQPQQTEAFRTSLLPENNIVDFNSLASEKKKTLSANPEEKRTLNDMQKARGADQPTPVMAMPMQSQQMQQPNMMQLSMNMNQLRLTDGNMQQQMYPNMQMAMNHPQMMMQPQMAMMSQPQMMNMQRMQQQQFAQANATMTHPSGTQQTSQTMNGANNPDPFNQIS